MPYAIHTMKQQIPALPLCGPGWICSGNYRYMPALPHFAQHDPKQHRTLKPKLLRCFFKHCKYNNIKKLQGWLMMARNGTGESRIAASWKYKAKRFRAEAIIANLPLAGMTDSLPANKLLIDKIYQLSWLLHCEKGHNNQIVSQCHSWCEAELGSFWAQQNTSHHFETPHTPSAIISWFAN